MSTPPPPSGPPNGGRPVRLLVTVLTYAKSVGADVFAYCCGVGPSLASDDRVENVVVSYTHGYPTDVVRNSIVAEARRAGFHYVLMLDDDMAPDLLVREGAPPFAKTALDFALAHDGPCVVAAPYCSGPPEQQVLVMKNREYFPDAGGGCGFKLDKYTRDEASVQTGVGRVSALATGCMLVDLRTFDVLPPPWFAYEYDDPPYNTRLASTEDVVFSRSCDWVGIPQFCAWDCWAGHVKTYTTGRPTLAPVTTIPDNIYRAWSAGWRPTRKTEPPTPSS